MLKCCIWNDVILLCLLTCFLGCDGAKPAQGSKPAVSVNMRFTDSNGDGKIDVMQIDHTTHHVTAWIDDDHDGRFDRRIYEIEGQIQTEETVDIQVPASFDE